MLDSQTNLARSELSEKGRAATKKSGNLGGACLAVVSANFLMRRLRNRSGEILWPVFIRSETGTRLTQKAKCQQTPTC
jgi:hypothetical protein